jgi:hypothetical protein
MRRRRRIASSTSLTDAVLLVEAAPCTARGSASRSAGACGGGAMLLMTAVGVLILWLLGVLGVYTIGDLVHVFLVAGLIMLLSALDRRRRHLPRQARSSADWR